jgi:hypothetical protein
MATETVERELRRRLRELLGDVAAMALIEKFPPEAQVDALRGEMRERFDDVDARFAQVDARFAEIDRRFDQVDARFEILEHRLTAVFRGELNAAVTAQTRTMMFSLLGAVVSVGGLALGMQQLAA